MPELPRVTLFTSRQALTQQQVRTTTTTTTTTTIMQIFSDQSVVFSMNLFTRAAGLESSSCYYLALKNCSRCHAGEAKLDRRAPILRQTKNHNHRNQIHDTSLMKLNP
jgi:hypothetical protein